MRRNRNVVQEGKIAPMPQEAITPFGLFHDFRMFCQAESKPEMMLLLRGNTSSFISGHAALPKQGSYANL